MYNPEYCARPHIVALNKMDLEEAAQLQEEVAAEVLTMAHKIQVCAAALALQALTWHVCAVRVRPLVFALSSVSVRQCVYSLLVGDKSCLQQWDDVVSATLWSTFCLH